MDTKAILHKLRDKPLHFAKLLWPGVEFYGKQREIIESIHENDETYVPAGNMLGKDFVAGFIALHFFLTREPVRVLTTSITDPHLDVLWAEIDRYIRTSAIPLRREYGGPLVYNHRHIRKVIRGELSKISYMRGIVASSTSRGEGLSGHHAPWTLFIVDEASGVPDVAWKMAQGWMKKALIIGNTNPCRNFFWQAVKDGDKPRKPRTKLEEVES